MADSYIRLIPDQGGKRVQTFENTVNSQTVQAIAVVLVDYLGVPLGNSLQTFTVNVTGNTNSTQVSYTHAMKVTAAAGVGAYTATLALLAEGRVPGSICKIQVAFAASTNPTVEIRNASAGGTLLWGTGNAGSALTWAVECIFDGSAWYLHNANLVDN